MKDVYSLTLQIDITGNDMSLHPENENEENISLVANREKEKSLAIDNRESFPMENESLKGKEQSERKRKQTAPRKIPDSDDLSFKGNSAGSFSRQPDGKPAPSSALQRYRTRKKSELFIC